MPSPTKLDQPEVQHEERVGERMRDWSELDNLKADVRQSKGKALTMPWRTGRPLRSAGEDPATGLPRTPLAALDMQQLVTPMEKGRLMRELDRVAITDSIEEGVLDTAVAAGDSLVVGPEEWWERAQQDKADEAAVAKQLEAEYAPCVWPDEEHAQDGRPAEPNPPDRG